MYNSLPMETALVHNMEKGFEKAQWLVAESATDLVQKAQDLSLNL